ncbi:MAG: spondin domain-containing protein [Chrysiogenetes bacterium]|nr:spondin domain-containing protein [Chrysiogenetes bacterium]
MKTWTIHGLLALLALVSIASCGDGMSDEVIDELFQPPPGATSSETCTGDDDAGYYRLVFASEWIAANFESYPTGAHFAMFTGATHNENVTFWEPGGMATLGIERMAEDGLNQTFANEIDAQIVATNARSKFSGSTLFVTTGASSRTINFPIWGSHTLVTVASMIAPTPDWFVGVNGVDLCDAMTGWKEEVVVEAFAYDAGTETGTGWTLTNPPEDPHLPIAMIPGAPFRDMVGGTLRRVGTFTFTRL